MEGGAEIDDDTRPRSRVLPLLANPLAPRILRALEGGPLRLSALDGQIASPSQTTMRAAVARLRSAGLLERAEVGRAPLRLTHRLTAAGRESLFVAETLERWLASCPTGPIPIGSEEARRTVEAIAWAFNPASDASPVLGPPPGSGNDPSRPLESRAWLRRALAPLCAAARWERSHRSVESVPITAFAIEAAFLVAMPLVELPRTAEGICVLAAPADVERGVGPLNLVGVTVEVEGGTVVGCWQDLEEDAPSMAIGSASAWLDAVIEGRLDRLRLGGENPQLPADLVRGLHAALFGEAPRI